MHNGLINFLDPIAKAWAVQGVPFTSSRPLKRKKTDLKPAKSRKKPKNVGPKKATAFFAQRAAAKISTGNFG